MIEGVIQIYPVKQRHLNPSLHTWTWVQPKGVNIIGKLARREGWKGREGGRKEGREGEMSRRKKEGMEGKLGEERRKEGRMEGRREERE